MDIAHTLLVALHLLGMAAILGGWFATRTSPRVHPAMLWGARAQIVTGLVLVGLAEAGIGTDGELVNHPKIGVKLVVALAVAHLTPPLLDLLEHEHAAVPSTVLAVGANRALKVAVQIHLVARTAHIPVPVRYYASSPKSLRRTTDARTRRCSTNSCVKQSSICPHSMLSLKC